MVDNGFFKVSTTNGATLTSDNVLNALQVRNQRLSYQQQQCAEAQEQLQQRAAEREAKQQQYLQQKGNKQKCAAYCEEADLQGLKQQRLSTHQKCNESRNAHRCGDCKVKNFFPVPSYLWKQNLNFNNYFINNKLIFYAFIRCVNCTN